MSARQVNMNYSTAAVKVPRILVICPKGVFPSAPLASVTSITSSLGLVSHERQSIIAY